MPQPGYYDTAEAFVKTFGKRQVYAVKMDQELYRSGEMFGPPTDPNDWASLDDKKLGNNWTGKVKLYTDMEKR